MAVTPSVPRTWNAFGPDSGLTAVFAQTPVAMAVLEGRELRYSFANPKYQQIIGDRDPVGARLIEMFPELAGSEIEGVIEGVFDTQESFSATDLLIRFDSQGTGEIDNYYDLAYHPLLDDAGGARGVLVVAVDVTERHAVMQAERVNAAAEAARIKAENDMAILEEVFRRAPSFLAVYQGPTHVYTMANEAYYQLVGPERDIIGKPLLEALPEVVGQGFDVLLDTVLRTGESFVSREIAVRLERGEGNVPDDRVVSLTYLPLLGAEGTPIGVIAHGADVTDYVTARRASERLLGESERARADADRSAQDAHRAREEAESANRAKAEFLAVMSHELRTPLNAIGGYTDLLLMGVRGPVSDAQRHDLNRIRSSQHHLLGLIEQVLSHARTGIAEVSLQTEDVDACAAIATAEALVAPQMLARGLNYVVTPCDTVPIVRADSAKLQQILLNLLGNAIKFTLPGGTLTSACESGQGMVTLSISDTGIGIPADKLAIIFEPFVQIDASLTRVHPGVGLGLAISRDLARRMGGDIIVDSIVGEGSQFSVTLPAS